MTLGSESVLKHRVGVSGTESNTATFCLDSHVIEEVWRLSGFDRSSRRLSVVMCVQSGTHTHTHTHAHFRGHYIDLHSFPGDLS